jgi:putative ABC transport system permease protein
MMALRLALADLRRDWAVVGCQVIAITVVLMPLLVLLGLKTGIIAGILERMRRDPANLQLRLVGNLALDEAGFARLAGLPEVGFAVPMFLGAGQILNLRPPRPGAGLTQVDVLPTAPGDPLRADPSTALAPDGIVVTAGLAAKLGLAVGDRVEAGSQRRGGGPPLRIALVVAELLREGVLDGNWALVHPSVLGDLLAYLDGFAVPGRGIEQGRPPGERTVRYESVRLYARDLDTVLPLVARLRQPPFGYDVRSRAEEVRNVRLLESRLATLFRLFVGIGAGYLAAVAAGAWIDVDRKRQALATLRLLGAPVLVLMAFPILRTGLATLMGAVLASLGFLAAASIMDRLLGGSLPGEGPVCTLSAGQVGAAVAASVLAAGLAASAAGWRAGRLDPAEVLRDA